MHESMALSNRSSKIGTPYRVGVPARSIVQSEVYHRGAVVAKMHAGQKPCPNAGMHCSTSATAVALYTPMWPGGEVSFPRGSCCAERQLAKLSDAVSCHLRVGAGLTSLGPPTPTPYKNAPCCGAENMQSPHKGTLLQVKTHT